MRPPGVIGIVGYRKAGKSLIVEHLIRHYGYSRVAFAKPLKDMLRAIGLDDVHLEGSLKEAPCDLLLGKSPRWAMQSLGTEWGRQLIGEKVWINLWRAYIRRNNLRAVACDDCRFLNEAEAIRTMGGLLIRVTRDGCGPSDHPSETESGIIACDVEVFNNGTQDDLGASIDFVLGRQGITA